MAVSPPRTANHKGRTFFADMHRKELKDDDQWMAKQVYLNVGNFLLGVAAMGLDAVPIEGIDFAILDEEFDLKAQGYTSLVVVPVGPAEVASAAVDDHYRDLIPFCRERPGHSAAASRPGLSSPHSFPSYSAVCARFLALMSPLVPGITTLV